MRESLGCKTVAHEKEARGRCAAGLWLYVTDLKPITCRCGATRGEPEGMPLSTQDCDICHDRRLQAKVFPIGRP